MYGYNQNMAEMHAVLGWCMLLLFLVRGMGHQFGAKWAEDSRLSVLAFGVVVLLSVTGLSLWALRFYNPMRDGWLMGKLLALLIYVEAAHVAMDEGRFHVLGYLSAMLLLAYMMGASLSRSPWLGLF